MREVLNRTALRRMAVLRPLKITIENYPEGQTEELEAVNHPEAAAAGTRRIKFSRELYVERDDFMENPPKKFYRLSPGKEVRLRYAYFVTCREAVKNSAGEVVELRCTYDPATRGGNAPDGRKVKATLHWVSAADAVPAEVRLYNPLFTRPDPDAGNFSADLNPNSLDVLSGAMVEPALIGDNAADAVQFERQGYFCRDRDSKPDGLVFNRTVGLRDTWAKVSGGKTLRSPRGRHAATSGKRANRDELHRRRPALRCAHAYEPRIRMANSFTMSNSQRFAGPGSGVCDLRRAGCATLAPSCMRERSEERAPKALLFASCEAREEGRLRDVPPRCDQGARARRSTAAAPTPSTL